TKAALLMLSKTMSTEFIPLNIRVNTVSPGLILTPDWVKTARQLSAPTGGDWEGYLQGVADEHAPIKRFGTVEELADFMVFLCSPRAAYAVGSTYHYDGGMLRTI
uniref:SDR family NAD(P)-dependent oxidoreductase n=1 Tax=Rubellimicrobium arenae TaxID=2817372 RepID=UPI001B3156C4